MNRYPPLSPSSMSQTSQIQTDWRQTRSHYGVYEPQYQPALFTPSQYQSYNNTLGGWGCQSVSLQTVEDLDESSLARENWSLYAQDPVMRRRPGLKSANRCIPLPHQVEHPEQGLIVHPLLEYDPHSQRPKIQFDLSLPPVEPQPGCFSQPATYHALPSLAVVVPNVPWVVVAHRSSMTFATIGDVLGTLWTSLQMPIDETSFQHRHARRRIDLLKGKRRFMGLSQRSRGEETFVLHIA